MSRWNIAEIIFYSHDDQVHSLRFESNVVTIISGDSNTGKSAIISTVDYCLGSSRCEIPVEIRQKVSCVAIKLKNREEEIISAREVSAGARVPNIMFILTGKNIDIPKSSKLLSGKTNVDGARYALEKTIGIIRVSQEGSSDRVSVRQTTAFTFLSDETIINKRHILHGLSDTRAAKHIIGAMPYFLGSSTIDDVIAEARIKTLKREIKEAYANKERLNDEQANSYVDAFKLLSEAKANGILESLGINNEPNYSTIISTLKKCLSWKPEDYPVIPSDSEDILANLLNQKEQLYSELEEINKLKRSVKSYNNAANEYRCSIETQKSKTDSIFYFQQVPKKATCPLCASALTNASDAHYFLTTLTKNLKDKLSTIKKTSSEVNKYISKLDSNKTSIIQEIKILEKKISPLIKLKEDKFKIYSLNQKAAMTVGKISFYMEQLENLKSYDDSIITDLENELSQIEDEHGLNAKREKLRIIQSIISGYANDYFVKLPRNEICEKGRLNFDASNCTLNLLELEKNRVYKMAEIGSDQNYLSIHLAFLFALHKYIAESQRPIPAFLIIDQVSRPYYPQNIKNSNLITLKETLTDADHETMMKYFEFIFKVVSEIEGLQLIILEHAYLDEMVQYVESTKYRWNSQTEEKLIPHHWPTIDEME